MKNEDMVSQDSAGKDLPWSACWNFIFLQSHIYLHIHPYAQVRKLVAICFHMHIYTPTHTHTHIWKLFSFQSRCGYLGIPGYSGIRLSSGVVIHRVTPTVLDLWYSIGSVNHFLMCYCAATLMLVRLMAHSSGVV